MIHWRENSRHAISDQIADGLYGPGASAVGQRAKDVNQSRRLLSLAAVLNGMSRTEAAMIGGTDPADPA